MNNLLNSNSKIYRKSNVLSCNVENETIVLDTDLGAYLGMNPVASRIWELLAEPYSINDLCEELLQEFAVDSNECFEQVQDFLQKLLELKVIQYQCE